MKAAEFESSVTAERKLGLPFGPRWCYRIPGTTILLQHLLPPSHAYQKTILRSKAVV